MYPIRRSGKRRELPYRVPGQNSCEKTNFVHSDSTEKSLAAKLYKILQRKFHCSNCICLHYFMYMVYYVLISKIYANGEKVCQ